MAWTRKFLFLSLRMCSFQAWLLTSHISVVNRTKSHMGITHHPLDWSADPILSCQASVATKSAKIDQPCAETPSYGRTKNITSCLASRAQSLLRRQLMNFRHANVQLALINRTVLKWTQQNTTTLHLQAFWYWQQEADEKTDANRYGSWNLSSTASTPFQQSVACLPCIHTPLCHKFFMTSFALKSCEDQFVIAKFFRFDPVHSECKQASAAGLQPFCLPPAQLSGLLSKWDILKI